MIWGSGVWAFDSEFMVFVCCLHISNCSTVTCLLGSGAAPNSLPETVPCPAPHEKGVNRKARAGLGDDSGSEGQRSRGVLGSLAPHGTPTRQPIPAPGTGVPRSSEIAPPQHSTVGLCRGPCGCPRGGGGFLWARCPCGRCIS